MRDYYLVDTRTNRIVNASMTARPGGPADAPENHVWVSDPPLAMLQAYEYWSRRP